jgi:hypothetical protein
MLSPSLLSHTLGNSCLITALGKVPFFPTYRALNLHAKSPISSYCYVYGTIRREEVSWHFNILGAMVQSARCSPHNYPWLGFTALQGYRYLRNKSYLKSIMSSRNDWVAIGSTTLKLISPQAEEVKWKCSHVEVQCKWSTWVKLLTEDSLIFDEGAFDWWGHGSDNWIICTLTKTEHNFRSEAALSYLPLWKFSRYLVTHLTLLSGCESS